MSCITSVDGIILWLLIYLVNYVSMLLVVCQTQPTFKIEIVGTGTKLSETVLFASDSSCASALRSFESFL